MPKTTPTRVDSRVECARLSAILKQLPATLISLLTAGQLSRAYQLNLHTQAIRRIKNEFLVANQDLPLLDKKTERPPVWLEQQMVLEQLGRVIAKTYAHVGDREEIGSEDALRLIHRALKEYDYSLITRYETRR